MAVEPATCSFISTPGCIACEQAARTIAALAGKYADDRTIAFAQIDVSINEVIAPGLSTLPGLYLFRANGTDLNDGVDYRAGSTDLGVADLEEASMEQFLAHARTRTLKGHGTRR